MLANLLRNPCAQRPLFAEQTHIGGDSGIAEKEGGRTLTTQRQRTIAINDGVDGVNEGEVAIEQHTSLQHADNLSRCIGNRRSGMNQHAAPFSNTAVRTGLGGRHDVDRRPIPQRGVDRFQRRLAVKIDHTARTPFERSGNDRPGGVMLVADLGRTGVADIPLGIEHVHEIKPVTASRSTDFLGNDRALAQRHGLTKTMTIGQCFDAAADATNDPVEILMSRHQIAADLVRQQLVITGIAPIPDERHDQREAEQQRCQRKK